MIIQCDQCKTKFRLDDSRVTDTGVKVRCSRCKNTFVVKKEVSENVADTPQTSKGPEIPASEAEKQNASTGFMPEQRTALPEEENKMVRDGGSLLNAGLPPVEAAQDMTANDGNRDGLVDFGFAGEPFADTGKEVESAPEEHRIVEDKKEDSFDWPGADFSGIAENEPDEGEQGSIRLGMEDYSVEAGKNASADGFSESQDFPGVPENDFSQSEESESVSDHSWNIFSQETDAEADAPDVTEKKFSLNSQEQDVENQGIISTDKDEYGMLSQKAVPVEDGASVENVVTDGETEAGEGSKPLDVMSPAAMGIDTSATHFGNAAEADDGDLPPLAITSRRKKSLFLPIALATLILIVIAAAGAAYYFSWIDFSSFNAVNGRSASSPGGEIAIRNLDGTYLHNVNGVDIFVVTGEAFNQTGEALSSVRVRGIIYGKKGEVLLNDSANFLNTLSRDQLTTLPVNEIEALFKNNTGKSPNDMLLQPGTAATFQIVFTHVPEGAGEFGAEVAGSEVVKR